MANTSAEVLWVVNLLRDLHISLNDPRNFFVMNKSAIFLTQNPVAHKRAKQIDIDYHFVREHVSSKRIVTTFIPSHRQIAYIFTKSLARPLFEDFRSKLRVVSNPTLRLLLLVLRALFLLTGNSV